MSVTPSSSTDSHEAFLALFARNQRHVFAYIGALLPNVADAEEVMQETSLVLWRKWHEFDASRDFMRWANGIAYRETLRYLREKKSGRLHFSDGLLAQIAAQYEERRAERDARQDALSFCLDKLDERDRELIRARYQHNSSVSDIAEALGRPVKSIYRSLERVRQRLVECVQRTVAAGERA